jgi:hypothetical protein
VWILDRAGIDVRQPAAQEYESGWDDNAFVDQRLHPPVPLSERD